MPYGMGADEALTARPVVDQVLEVICKSWPKPPRHMLDPSAGYGVFGAAMRQAFPDCTTTGVESHHECFPSLAGNYDYSYAMSLGRALHDLRSEHSKFDLIITNPPFSKALEWIAILRKLLTHDGNLIFLAPNGLGQRGRKRSPLFADNLPKYQFRIMGPIEFKGPEKAADQRDYSWWQWGRYSSDYHTWLCGQLPWLLPSRRRWLTPPGKIAAG